MLTTAFCLPIVRATTELGHNFEMKITAKDVEICK